MEARLSGFESLAPAARGDAIKAVLTEVIGAGDATAAQVVLAHVLRESFPLTISRTVVAHFATEVASASAAPDILPIALRELQPRAASFADSDTAMRRQYADVLCESGKYISAARVLARINLDASGRTASADDKCNLYVKIAEYFLEEGDTVSAEQYIKKASEFIHSVGDAHLALRFRVCYARVQDSQKKFLEASLKYYTLSQIQDDTIAQDDILTLLFSALTCACLAKAGPQRSRIMDTLHRDARTPMVDGFFMLDKMYKGEIVRKEEVERFRELLLPHHVADLPGGLTVYDRAIVQHNLLAASRVYESVSFDGLGTLLSIDPRKAEKIAATMIVEGRLQGSIDQVDDMLLFESDKEALKSWDVRLQRLCGAVASCAAEVEKVIGEPTNA